MRLILFDIDGTLLRCGPQVGPLFAGALEEVYGATGRLDGFSFAGKTDPGIVVELLTGHGLSHQAVEAGLEAVRANYLRRLDAGLERDKMALLPGVTPLLDALSRREDLAVGLLTGNWKGGARIKLGRLDLNRYFPFGAFGEDAANRRGLPPIALQRAAQRAGRAFRADDTLIVGDTLHDIDCARAHDIPVLAVATGSTPAPQLRQAGADFVVSSLEEVDERLCGWA